MKGGIHALRCVRLDKVQYRGNSRHPLTLRGSHVHHQRMRGYRCTSGQWDSAPR